MVGRLIGLLSNSQKWITESYIVKYIFFSFFLDLITYNFELTGNTLMDTLLSKNSESAQKASFFQKVKYLLSLRTQAVIPVLQWAMVKYRTINRSHITMIIGGVIGGVASVVLNILIVVLGQWYYNNRDLTIISILTGDHITYSLKNIGMGLAILFSLAQLVDYLGTAMTTVEYVEKRYVWKPYQQIFSHARILGVVIVGKIGLSSEQAVLGYALIELIMGSFNFLIGVAHIIYRNSVEKSTSKESSWIVLDSKIFYLWLQILLHKYALTRHRLEYLLSLSRVIEIIPLRIAQAWMLVIGSHFGHFARYALSDKIENRSNFSEDLKNAFIKPRYKAAWITLLLAVACAYGKEMTSEIRVICLIFMIIHSSATIMAMNMDQFLSAKGGFLQTAMLLSEIYLIMDFRRKILIEGYFHIQILESISALSKVYAYIIFNGSYLVIRAIIRYS